MDKIKKHFIHTIVDKTGSLYKIGYSVDNLNNMQELIEKANNISLLFNTGKAFLRDYRIFLTRALRRKECNVRFLIAKQSNKVFECEELYKPLCPDTSIISELKDCEEIVKSIIGDLSSFAEKGSITLKAFSYIPSCSIIIIDKTVKFTPYISNLHSRDSLSVFGELTSDASTFQTFQEAFDASWKSIYTTELLSSVNAG